MTDQRRPEHDDRAISLTDVEWRIMRALWDLAAPTLGQVVKEVADVGWTRHAVSSFLKRLELKGMVAVDASQRPGRYQPLISREQAQQSEAQSVLHKVYGGDLLLMVTNAVSSGQLSDQETQALIDLLQKGG